MKIAVTIIMFLAIMTCVSGQTDTSAANDTTAGRSYLIQNVERNGETLPEVEIKEVTVVPRPTRESGRSEYRKYERMIYNIKKVYPYALIVRSKLDEVNYKMSGMKSDKEKREYIRKFEKDIFNEFQGDISKLTISQGKILIKLIDRETQNTSFDLIREYRGKFTAAFWQGIARIFGTNLKDEYDPYGNDALMEIIIDEIEAGRL